MSGSVRPISMLLIFACVQPGRLPLSAWESAPRTRRILSPRALKLLLSLENLWLVTSTYLGNGGLLLVR
jgi:hypothetical protein